MSKNKDRKRAGSKQALPGGSLRQEVERLIQKGWLKDAVKQAKMCYRQESTPENHRLLERAYFLRAQELHREAIPESAAEVARHLLDFGVTDPDLPAELAPLLLAVGLSGPAMALRERLGSPEAQARLILTASDQAVLHLDRAPASLPEIRVGALLVRGALEALDDGDEAGALDRLRDVARSSPFADWRYFVRGLAAMRRGDAEQVAANWDRLDAGRAASRIARSLRGSTGGPPEPHPGPTADINPSALEAEVFGEPILTRIEQLRQLVAEGRWTEAIRLLAPLRFSLRRVDPRLAERLTRVLIAPLVKATQESSFEEARDLVGNFARVAEPLPIDPRWNRLRALIWEGPQEQYDESEDYWHAYRADLKTLPDLTPEERQRAQALVWEHLGKQYADEATIDRDDHFGYRPSDRELAFARMRAIECLEESLRVDPTHLAPYRVLINVHEAWGQPDKAEAAARRLLEAFPNHDDTLLWLTHHHFGRDDPEQALPYLQRARALKPLGESLRHTEWSLRVALARHHALEHRWDEGRAEFALAEPLWPEQSGRYTFAARRAVFELKAGQVDRAEELIEAARHRLVEPIPIWLAVLIEGTRYRLPKATMDRFDHLWQVGLAGKGKSETAGALAELLTIYLAGNTEYTGRAGHVQELVGYLKRASRIRYRREDLVQVCVFLKRDPNAKALLEKLTKRGLKNFPDSAEFHFFAAALELEKGLSRADLRQVRKGMEKALELAQASSGPMEAGLVPELKRILSKLADATSGPLGMPFPGFGGHLPRDLSTLFASLDTIEDEDEDDDEDYDDPPSFGRSSDTGPSPAGPSPGGPEKKKKRKKKKR